MTKPELLKLIGTGTYGSEIPNDDDTNGLLSELMDEGLIRGEQSRLDDFLLADKGRASRS